VLDRTLQCVIKTGVIEVFRLCYLSSLHLPFSDEEFLDAHFCHSFPPHHHGTVVFGLFEPFYATLPQLFLEFFLTQQRRIHLTITASAPHGGSRKGNSYHHCQVVSKRSDYCFRTPFVSAQVARRIYPINS